ncbi:PLD nuclease N-terminal domain-containing protein [Myceligenerans cantabricum]
MRPLLLGVLYVALVVYALVDVIQSDDDDRHGLHKGLWVAVIIFLPLVGSIAWIILSYIARRKKGRASAAGWDRAGGTDPTPLPPAADRPPKGPEDDSEYMWLLEQARRKKERENQAAAGAADGPGDESPGDEHSGTGPAGDGTEPSDGTGTRDDRPRPDGRPQDGGRPQDPTD